MHAFFTATFEGNRDQIREWIKKGVRAPNTKHQTRAPIIALTASTLEEDKAQVLSVGYDDFIRKPFHENDIFDAIEKHIGVQYVYEEEQKAEGRG